MSDLTRLRPGDPATRLDGVRRSRDLVRAKSGARLDVLVVGAGITGAGVALDAASRGLSVLLVDRDDLAYGTSRWSSKLVHGGLRYLAKGDVGIAWESAVERRHIAQRIAPHLVRPMPQLIPVYRGHAGEALATRLGYGAADILKVASGLRPGRLPRARWIDAGRALRLVPALDPDGLRGAILGHDFQLVDDARLVVAVARTAAAFGVGVLTRVEAMNVDGDGRALLHDRESDEQWSLAADTVVNATGVWADALEPGITLRPSRGTHLIVPSALVTDSGASLTLPVPGHFGRYIFTLPQVDGTTYVGLTDVPQDRTPRGDAAPPEEDIAWILSILNSRLRRPLERSDVLGAFVGYRPLLVAEPGAQRSSADISRRHAVTRRGRLITVTGGKLTTYRRMAEDVVDLITDRPCRTTGIELVGSGPVGADQSGAPSGHPLPELLVRRYGSEAALVWSLGDDDPSLRQPVASDGSVLGVELAFGAQWEGARTVSDLLERRTRLALVPQRGAGAQDLAADLVRRFVTHADSRRSAAVG